MTQSAYYRKVKVNTYCFVISSLSCIYKTLTDYCNKMALKIINTFMIIFYGRIELASLYVSLFPTSTLFAVDCIS
jgi:hypothetical protein